MTAKEKFEARLKEEGLYNEWYENQCGYGQIAKFKDDKSIVLFVHEADDDAFTEQHFPSFDEMRSDEYFVRYCKDEFYSNVDKDFVKKLALWLELGSNFSECPLYPVDAYFPGSHLITEYKDFEDDVETIFKFNPYETKMDYLKVKQSVFNAIYRRLVKGAKFNPKKFRSKLSYYSVLYSLDILFRYDTELSLDDSMLLISKPKNDNSSAKFYLGSDEFPLDLLFRIYDSLE